MRKLALLLAPLIVLMTAIPIAIAALVTVVSAPAAAQELRTLQCQGAIPATGSWRPPFQQAYTLSSRGFGMEYHPTYHDWRMHTGQDLVSQPGPGPVVAVAAGVVTFAGTMGGYGNVVDVEHTGGIHSRYAHLASIAANITTGTSVTIGQRLGVEGSTGTSTGNHLHFEIRKNDTPIDPVPFMLAHGAPLNGQAVAPSPPGGNKPPPGGVQEGGIGFELPPPGTPRKDSLARPAMSIPPQIKEHYLAAGRKYGIPWTLLAGIGMEETEHGRNENTSSAGALGLMQFMPATWATMGVDGDGDGIADIRGDADSVFSAANYLTRAGVTKGPGGVRAAIFVYNHADWYVNDVLFYAEAYGGGLVLGDPTDCSNGGNGNPNLPPLTNERVKTLLTWAQSKVGDPYVFGANGPDGWDCSSLTQAAYAQIGISMPRTAGAQRDWLAQGNGFRVPYGQERPGDLIFADTYLGPTTIGHVMIVFDPATHETIEAGGTRVGNYDYSHYTAHAIFQIWRVGNVADEPSRTP